MQWQLLFLSIAPLVVYLLFWTRGEPRIGIGAAVVVAAMELAYNSLQLGFLEPFSLSSFLLYGLLGGAALLGRDDRLFKLQPTFFELGLAAALVYYNQFRPTPLLVVIVEDYLGLYDVIEAYQQGYARVYATTLSRSLPYLLLVHASLTGYGALRRSTWWWFNVRVLGFYFLLAALFLAERLLGLTA